MDKTLSPPAGQLLDGRYRVESMLARGGMATVYLGTDTRLDRTVALKIAHPELSGDAEFVRRFIGEARSAAKLSGPNVVAVYDQGSHGDVHYIAMEYVPGLTLRALLDERGRLGPRQALDIIEGVLTGLAVAHQSGIVHRDVKPENVLLTLASSVKVVDFGLARAAARADHTKAGMIIGTAAYLAPEQVSRSTSDERSDVYAVGVMLFELLTGTQPHKGDTPLDVAYKHVSDIVPPPSTIVPELPPALDALVALATSRDPDLRPADAGHFLLAITEVRRGMPIAGLRSRGAHAAPGSDHVAGAPGGLASADPRPTGAPAPGQLAPDGQLTSELRDSGPGSRWQGSGPLNSSMPGSSMPGSGPLNSSLPGSGWPGSSQPGGLPGSSMPGSSGPLNSSLPGSGWPGSSQPGSSQPGGLPGSGRLPDGQNEANSLTEWPQAPGSHSGASSWPPSGHSSAAEPPHGTGVTGPSALSPSSPGGYARSAELLPALAAPPADAYNSANHTLIVAPGILADGYSDEPGYYQGEAGRRYRGRRGPGLQGWLFSRRLGYLAAVLAVVLVAGLAFWWLSAGQYATVPRLDQIAASTARTELGNLGFRVRTGAAEHSVLQRGDVIRTIPAGGSRAKHGSTVTIIESLGPVLVSVPPVTGMPQADAISKLKQAGLLPGTITPQTSTTIPAGIVISTTPVAGVRWPKTKPVAMTVSAGLPLPDFVGQMVSAAQAAAQAGGYSIDPIQNAKGTEPAGTITRQSPAAGSPIAPSEVVTVYFSPGPPMAAVPDVQFMHQDEAVRALRQAGFKVVINKVGPGDRVVDFSPNGNQPVGTTITINVGFP